MYFTSSGINTSEPHQGQSNHTETTDAWYIRTLYKILQMHDYMFRWYAIVHQHRDTWTQRQVPQPIPDAISNKHIYQHQ